MQVDASDRGLIRLLQSINAERMQGSQTEEARHAEEIAESLFSASTLLAVYGTLAPREENEWVLQPLRGQWREGFVCGQRLEPGSWGGGIEYPGMRWEPEGNRFAVKMFASVDLPHEWERLDKFEGKEYLRILVPVERGDGTVAIANIYSSRE